MTAVLHRSDSALPAFGHFRPSHCSSTPYESQQQVMDPHHYGYRAPTRTVSDDTSTTSTITSTFHGRAPQQPYVPFSSPSSSTPRTPIPPRTFPEYSGATQQPPSGPNFFARPVVGGHFAFLTLGQACGGEAMAGLDFLDDSVTKKSKDLDVDALLEAERLEASWASQEL